MEDEYWWEDEYGEKVLFTLEGKDVYRSDVIEIQGQQDKNTIQRKKADGDCIEHKPKCTSGGRRAPRYYFKR